MSEGYCIGCQVKLGAIDDDPNGEANCVCARCRAEENHDFDAEPDVVYDRLGRRVEDEPPEVESSMRDLIIQEIFDIKKHDNFDSAFGRWQRYYLLNNELCWIASKATARRQKTAMHIMHAKREDWDKFTNANLLTAFKVIWRQHNKQM
jgi:hypothetical protein